MGAHEQGFKKVLFLWLASFLLQIPMLWYEIIMQNVVACLKEIDFLLWDSIVKMFVGCLNYVNMKTAYEYWCLVECDWVSVCLSSFMKTS